MTLIFMVLEAEEWSASCSNQCLSPWGTTRQHCVGIKVSADTDITLNDGMEDKFIDAIVVYTQKERLEEYPARQSLFLTVTMTWLSGSS